MTGRELAEMLNYTGMEVAARKLLLKEKFATAEKVAVMSKVDVCDEIVKHYDVVSTESECVTLVKPEDIATYYSIVKCLPR